MSADIPEADWKVLRSLQEPLRERFCQRALKGMTDRAGAEGSFYARYLEVYKHLREQDENLGLAFDHPKRSNAIQKIMTLYSRGLLREEEFRRFSEETQARVAGVCEDAEFYTK